jgi:hypothetical protein
MTQRRSSPPANKQPAELPAEWQEQAKEAARRFKIPMPGEEDVGSPDEAEQRLRDFEQEGGE